ncbi:MAG: LapA family protein [Prochloraceae cyanobacterium]|nr:LapA family protein [Prochloraceae cyanobacterium]
MGSINFLIIFVFCVAMVFFGIENTESATIQIIPDRFEFQAPISIELIGAMGVGAVLAWLFSVWTGIQNKVADMNKERKVKAKEKEIKSLEQDLARLKEESEKQKQLLPSTEE